MDGALNFTATFSHGVEWGWPIAVYLLLAGMSGGALIRHQVHRIQFGELAQSVRAEES